MKSKGWKFDVDIYDRPGWPSFTYQFPIWGGIRKRENNEIVIRFDTCDDSGIHDDFYMEHYRQVVLSSKDGGLSWEEIEPDFKYFMPLRLQDGTLLEVLTSSQFRTKAEQKSRLDELGIGHIWRDDCRMPWDMWPSRMEEQLRKDHLMVWSTEVAENGKRYLPPGVVATVAPERLIVRTSTDNGQTWRELAIPQVDGSLFGHLTCCFPGAVELQDGTVLVPFYGMKKEYIGQDAFFETRIEQFVLRSKDKGESWEVIQIPMMEEKSMNETCLVAHPSGRVVAVLRGGLDRSIYASISDDGGSNWSAPKRTGMRGDPMNAICLKSGNILCVHGQRWFPAGIRAELSYDRGETWDVENMKILRATALPSTYNGGPGSVQLDDGTIFSFYDLVRIETPKKEDRLELDKQLVMNPEYHTYISGSRYTEDYIKPMGGTK